MEVARDLRQRGRHHRDVQQEHERRDADDDECPPRAFHGATSRPTGTPPPGIYGRHVHFEHDGPAVIAGERILTYADLRAAQPKGDSPLKVPVRIVGGNTPEFVLALFAAWNAGATAVPLNGRLREYELGAIDANLKGTVPLTLPLGSTILYTSGSTGVPKGAYL